MTSQDTTDHLDTVTPTQLLTHRHMHSDELPTQNVDELADAILKDEDALTQDLVDGHLLEVLHDGQIEAREVGGQTANDMVALLHRPAQLGVVTSPHHEGQHEKKSTNQKSHVINGRRQVLAVTVTHVSSLIRLLAQLQGDENQRTDPLHLLLPTLRMTRLIDTASKICMRNTMSLGVTLTHATLSLTRVRLKKTHHRHSFSKEKARARARVEAKAKAVKDSSVAEKDSHANLHVSFGR
jgi:hypothetical protein